MSPRASYFIRRLILIVPTFIGITFLSYLLCQLVPGGPVEEALRSMRGMGAGGEMRADSNLTEEYREELEKQFGFDRPLLVQYYDWLVNKKIGMSMDSYKYPNKTAWELIAERFPISLTFGITSFFLTYLVCIPLGIAKAMRNGSMFDVSTSVVVFVGYAIPAFAFGMVLKMLFSGTSEQFWDFFPLGGFRSDDWESLSFWAKVKDQAHHMFLPIVCYVIGNFAVLTLLMKNSLLEQISQDYTRTVVAKGGSMRRAVWRHALRNAFIPIATGLGGVLSVMFASSVLIEKVFNIPGLGLLSLDAIVGKDYAVFMGILALTSLVGMLGRILSDICYVMVDPRITFGKE